MSIDKTVKDLEGNMSSALGELLDMDILADPIKLKCKQIPVVLV